MGPMVDFDSFLTRKYDILQQQADSARLGAVADANLNTVRAGLLPAESAANVGLTKANTALSQATARQQDEETKYIGPIAQANIGETRQRSSLLNQQAVGEYQLNKLTTNPFKFRGIGNIDQIDALVRKGLRLGMGAFGSSVDE